MIHPTNRATRSSGGLALMADKIRNVFVSHIHEDDAGLAKLKGGSQNCLDLVCVW